MQLVFRTLTQCPWCTDRLLALFFFSIHQYKKNEKHAQGCPLVAKQVVAPRTAECQGLEKKGGGEQKGWGEQTAGGRPVLWADL